jgi:hypothetical protein
MAWFVWLRGSRLQGVDAWSCLSLPTYLAEIATEHEGRGAAITMGLVDGDRTSQIPRLYWCVDAGLVYDGLILASIPSVKTKKSIKLLGPSE